VSSIRGSIEPIRRCLRDRETRTGIWVASELTDSRGDHSDSDRRLASNRIVQEAMRSISRDGGASGVRIQAVNREARLEVCVEDGGVGFKLLSVTASYPRRGLALMGRQQRARAIGETGEIDLDLGCGTRITISVPIPLGTHCRRGRRSRGYSTWTGAVAGSRLAFQ
jgi:signal transduction histidine kinase